MNDHLGPWRGSGAGCPFLITSVVLETHDLALAWLLGQVGRVGGRVVALETRAPLFRAEAIYLDTLENRRTLTWLPAEAFRDYGLTWGTSYYTKGATT